MAVSVDRTGRGHELKERIERDGVVCRVHQRQQQRALTDVEPQAKAVGGTQQPTFAHKRPACIAQSPLADASRHFMAWCVIGARARDRRPLGRPLVR